MAQIANIAGYIREARDEKKRKRETEDKLLDTVPEILHKHGFLLRGDIPVDNCIGYYDRPSYH